MTTTNATSNNGGILSSLGNLVFGDSSSAGLAVVQNRSLTSRFGSWESDKPKVTNPEDAVDAAMMDFRKNQKINIQRSRGTNENGMPVSFTAVDKSQFSMPAISAQSVRNITHAKA